MVVQRQLFYTTIIRSKIKRIAYILKLLRWKVSSRQRVEGSSYQFSILLTEKFAFVIYVILDEFMIDKQKCNKEIW